MEEKNIEPQSGKLVVKQKKLLFVSIIYAVLLAASITLTVFGILRSAKIPSILFAFSSVLYGYSTLYVLSRTQYESEVLVVSFRKLMIIAILTVFAALAPLYNFFSLRGEASFYSILSIVTASLAIINAAFLFIAVAVLRKKAKKILAEKRHNHRGK